MTSDQERINKAFDTLEELGYETQAAKWCCTTCSVADFETNKFAFYHEQDAEAFDEEGNIIDDIEHRNGKVYIGHGEDGDGFEIAKALSDQGLVIEWDGSLNTKIAVMHNDRVHYTHPELA